MKNYELRMTNCELLFVKILCAVSILCGTGFFVQAQSVNQNFPTAVSSNEISGTIRARDIGDARLTSYFYTFNGVQGDIFINVVTKNLDGDIDVFTADNLRPLTKIRVYSDNPEGETGRVIYLRQPQKMILRVEGRTPTDDPASFRIKFAGSFQPAAAVAETEDSKQPEVKSNEESDVRVNSVGTIIEIKPRPTPQPPTANADREESKKSDEKPETAKKDAPEDDRDERKPEVVVTENLPEKKDDSETEPEATVAKETPEKRTPPRRRVNPRTNRNTPKTETAPKTTPEKKAAVTPVPASELMNIRLVVDFKDGRKIERPMSEVLKFGVDKGILTIIAKDGSIGRYSILDIAKITVE